jgi:hypothetical protein
MLVLLSLSGRAHPARPKTPPSGRQGSNGNGENVTEIAKCDDHNIFKKCKWHRGPYPLVRACRGVQYIYNIFIERDLGDNYPV